MTSLQAVSSPPAASLAAELRAQLKAGREQLRTR
jgi:hypothetical protein